MNDYQLGDAYQDDMREQVINALGKYFWTCEPKNYLSYVKYLIPRWPQLELLADFMEVGTIPTRWCIFPGEKKNKPLRYTYPTDMEAKLSQQTRRASRVNVALLQYRAEGKPILKRFQSRTLGNSASSELEKAVNRVKEAAQRDSFNLFVIEDLSRDVIEILGGTFGIDPRFFRAHIIDQVWNNVRDRWREPSVLEVDAQRRDWFQMRLMRSRYFVNQTELHGAEKETNDFNIKRRLIADQNHIFWDKDPKGSTSWWPKRGKPCGTEPVDAKIGHIRSRATFWLDPDSPTGVLLLEPTPKAGYPLWRGYGNWDDIPKFEHRLYDHVQHLNVNLDIPPFLRAKESDNEMSWFEDYLFWAQRPAYLVKPPGTLDSTLRYVPIQSLLHLVCGEWLTFADYLNTRLNQIDWGIAKPSFFPNTDSRKQSLRKLHFWRRSVPQARDMLQGSIHQVFQFNRSPDVPQITKPYKDDFKTIMDRLNECELRIDRLSSAVNSAIGLDDARSTSNLTLLASIFIPPSLIAALLSMSTDPLADLYPALKWWGIISTTAVALIFGILSAVNWGEMWLRKISLALTSIPMSYKTEKHRDGNWQNDSLV